MTSTFSWITSRELHHQYEDQQMSIKRPFCSRLRVIDHVAFRGTGLGEEYSPNVPASVLELELLDDVCR